MKIKIAFLTDDGIYLSRISEAYSKRYGDTYEVLHIEDIDNISAEVTEKGIDILAAEDTFAENVQGIPTSCAVVWLTEERDEENTENGIIFIFTKLDVIFKTIEAIYKVNLEREKIRLEQERLEKLRLERERQERERREREERERLRREKEEQERLERERLEEERRKNANKIIVFMSPHGGTGASATAAACSVRFAGQDKKILYLNLERIGCTSSFFHSRSGSMDLSGVIYAVKSRSTHEKQRIKKCLQQDESGVYFYAQPKSALDMVAMKPEDIVELLERIKETELYDYIIIDMDFIPEAEYLEVYDKSKKIIFISDGTEIANEKTMRAHDVLAALEISRKVRVSHRVSVVYNKFVEDSGQKLDSVSPMPEICSLPICGTSSPNEVIKLLATVDALDKVIEFKSE